MSGQLYFEVSGESFLRQPRSALRIYLTDNEENAVRLFAADYPRIDVILNVSPSTESAYKEQQQNITKPLENKEKSQRWNQILKESKNAN